MHPASAGPANRNCKRERMIKTVRAAGFAAAAFLVAAVAGWGGPLQAGQGPVAPSTSSYFDHMAADSGVSDLGLNAPATETGASATAGGWAAAMATFGSESSRETARATPQDMADLIMLGRIAFRR